MASSGDSGTVSWPSVSPNVLAVGGTTLTASSSGAYSGETAWSDSGGGVSLYEALPSYQKMIGISASGRVTPDVSYDANPSTGFQVYDTEGESGWTVVGGTSAGAPQWAGIIAIANEQRAANGTATPALTQANAMIYTISLTKASQDFHDVTSGRNSSGFSATTGYDAVTGLGSPIVSSLVGDLATQTATSGPTSTTKIPSATPEAPAVGADSEAVAGVEEAVAGVEVAVVGAEGAGGAAGVAGAALRNNGRPRAANGFRRAQRHNHRFGHAAGPIGRHGPGGGGSHQHCGHLRCCPCTNGGAIRRDLGARLRREHARRAGTVPGPTKPRRSSSARRLPIPSFNWGFPRC